MKDQFFGVATVDCAIALLRLSLGAFFAISGYHKLFNRGRHVSLVATLRADRIPFIAVNQWFVPTVELVAGVALAIGLATIVSALLLGAVCLVATCTDGLTRIAGWKPLDKADWLDDVLYLPEVMYGIGLIVILLIGPGSLSLDHLLF